jgi:hypothetical protein
MEHIIKSITEDLLSATHASKITFSNGEVIYNNRIDTLDKKFIINLRVVEQWNIY